MYDVTLMFIHVIITAVENNKYYVTSVCICSLRHPARNVPVPCCHLWCILLYNIFPHNFINITIWGGGGEFTKHKMCVSIFCTNIVWNIFPSKNVWTKYEKKCIFVFMFSTLYSWMIIMKLEFYGQFLKKISNIKFHENLSSGRWVVPCRQTSGWTDGQTWWS
jgi:hypothetical protein